MAPQTAMLDVSRDTVREATASLAEAGFLDIRRGRYGGTLVRETLPEETTHAENRVSDNATLNSEDINDVLIYREVLEVGAVRAAAVSDLSSESRDELWRAHLECSHASAKDYRRQDSRFHLLLAEVTGSQRLVREVASTRMRVNEMLNRIPLLAPNISHSTAQHEEVVSAILRGQADLAAIAMRDQLEGTATLLRGFLG